MGAGKTSVGRLLARLLSWPFTDLDDVVQAREHCSVAEIFQKAGEAAFRQAEKAALLEVLANLTGGPQVIALGGGAFVQPENAAALRQTGVPVVFLDAPLEELRRRCAQDGDGRPLFRDENQFRQLYETRRHCYMEADLRVETEGATPDQVATLVATRLGWEEV